MGSSFFSSADIHAFSHANILFYYISQIVKKDKKLYNNEQIRGSFGAAFLEGGEIL